MSGTPTFALAPYLEERRARVEAALERGLEGLLPLLPRALRAPVRHGVTTGGKRLRPILCMAAYEACGGAAGDEIADVAVSLELIHAYSLMHDDLPCMDDAPLRRGRPTPHTVHGEGPTLAGGASLIPGAHLHLWRAAGRLGVPDRARRELLRVLGRAAGETGMVGGQALDLLGEGRALAREELDRLHRAKTGALLTASLEMGAVSAGTSEPVRTAFREYGAAVGLAFQITDDILDATADARALGKNPSDEALGKSTYVGLLGVEGARDEALTQARRADDALARAGIRSPALEALSRFVVNRDR
jgi:geranylgeranyl diphosphate synthase, type II